MKSLAETQGEGFGKDYDGEGARPGGEVLQSKG